MESVYAEMLGEKKAEKGVNPFAVCAASVGKKGKKFKKCVKDVEKRMVKEGEATIQDEIVAKLEKRGFQWKGEDKADGAIYMSGSKGGSHFYAEVGTDGSVNGGSFEEFVRNVPTLSRDEEDDRPSHEYDEPYYSEDEMY